MYQILCQLDINYLLYDLQSYILCTILNYKNLQFKQFIDDIVIDI